MVWNYRPYIWLVYGAQKLEGVQAKNENNSLWLLTIPAPVTVPNNLTFSDICTTAFLAKCVDDEEPFVKVALTKANWVANRYCVAVTCHTSHRRACVCMSSTTGTTVGNLEPPDSSPCASILICMDTDCFVLSTLRPIPILRTPLASLLSIF